MLIEGKKTYNKGQIVWCTEGFTSNLIKKDNVRKYFFLLNS
jgi:hypothetical protein